MNNQNKLVYIVRNFIKPIEWPTLRGVMVCWEDKTLCLNFFFDGQISDLLKENASILATEIIAQYPEGSLKETYTEMDYTKPLPDFFWVYKKISE